MNPGISGVFLKTGPGTPLGVAPMNLNLVNLVTYLSPFLEGPESGCDQCKVYWEFKSTSRTTVGLVGLHFICLSYVRNLMAYNFICCC